MIRCVSLAVMIVASVAASAQSFVSKRTKSTAEDYVLLMESKGYKSYAFDMMAFKDATYWLEPVIRHFHNGKEVDDYGVLGIRLSTRDMVSPESDDEKSNSLTSERYDAAKGIRYLCERLRVGFIPTDSSNVVLMQFHVTEGGSITLPLFLEKQRNPKSGELGCTIGYRPFRVERIELGKFVPLAMVGAHWYDDDIESFRFCGDDELTEGMTEDMLKFIPDYYVVGMKVYK